MHFILVDTCVFTRLQGNYQDLLKCIFRVSDVIGITREIIDEYEGRACPSKEIMRAFIAGLKGKNKVRYFNSSSINSALRRHRRPRRVIYPEHNRDRKWIDVAIAVRAKCVISINNHLLRTGPNRSNGGIIEMLDPTGYIETRCPGHV